MEFKIIKNNGKIDLIQKLIYELDDLYEERQYDLENSDERSQDIESKIMIREKTLKQIVNDI